MMGTDYLRQIQKVIDYIEHSMMEDLPLAKLAKVACFSEYHFHRVFQTMVGDPVMEYVHFYTRFSQTLSAYTGRVSKTGNPPACLFKSKYYAAQIQPIPRRN